MDSIAKRRIERFKRICQQVGLRMTHQRLQIFQQIAGDDSHPSAETIYARVRRRMPTISFDTVYRTLAVFEQLDIIRKVQAISDRARYDPNHSQHHHLVCVECKSIADFDWPEADGLALPAAAADWGAVAGRHLELRGVCADCRQGGRETDPD